jgi:hypothetical protein
MEGLDSHMSLVVVVVVEVVNTTMSEPRRTTDVAVDEPAKGFGLIYRSHQHAARIRLCHILGMVHVAEGVAVVVGVARHTGCGSAVGQPETPLGRCRIGAG